MSVTEGTFYAPFSIIGMSPDEEKEYQEWVDRSIGALINSLIEADASIETFFEILKWLDLQEADYAYEKDLIRNHISNQI